MKTSYSYPGMRLGIKGLFISLSKLNHSILINNFIFHLMRWLANWELIYKNCDEFIYFILSDLSGQYKRPLQSVWMLKTMATY